MRGCSGGGVRGCSRGACMVAPGGVVCGCLGGGGACVVAPVNERMVRILLECILVLDVNSHCMKNYIFFKIKNKYNQGHYLDIDQIL